VGAVSNERQEAERDIGSLWRGVDLSGNTVVIGLGEGLLIQALSEHALSAGGQVIALSRRMAEIESVTRRIPTPGLQFVQSRPRALPLLDGTVDLMVLSSAIRQVPTSALSAFFEEVWRVLVPGGRLRLSDVLQPSEAEYNEAWRLRNALIERLAQAIGRPTALYANLPAVAQALTQIGFENLAVSLLPGYPLTEAWLDNTEEAVLAMASRPIDPDLRQQILERDLPRLIAAFRSGDQRAAERFVLRGAKAGGLALDMEASFTEADLVDQDDN